MEQYQKKQHVSDLVSFSCTKGNIDIFPKKQFHEYYEFYFLLNGNVDFLNDHLRLHITPFTLVIIPPNVYHQFIVRDDADSYERYVLNVNENLLGKTLMRDALNDKELFVLSRNHRIVEDFFCLGDSLEIMSESDFSLLLTSAATDIVLSVKYLCANVRMKQERLPPFALKLMQYINSHYVEIRSLEELSKQLNFSVSVLSHTFKKNFGISIKKYIQQKRMTAINCDLKNGEKPERISCKYGFTNYSTFYRAYKSHFGVSPSATQKENGGFALK